MSDETWWLMVRRAAVDYGGCLDWSFVDGKVNSRDGRVR
jgi:hypothetical protein